MPKTAVSVTLDGDNLTWLRARARGGHARSLSEVLDRLVTEARAQAVGTESRSVSGTIDVDPSDPLLEQADEAIRMLVANSLGRPMAVKEKRSTYRPRGRARRG